MRRQPLLMAKHTAVCVARGPVLACRYFEFNAFEPLLVSSRFASRDAVLMPDAGRAARITLKTLVTSRCLHTFAVSITDVCHRFGLIAIGTCLESHPPAPSARSLFIWCA